VLLIQSEEAKLVAEGRLPDGDRLHVAQEGFFGMVPDSYFRRIPRIREFQLAHVA
jgi:hypothetical protein